MKRFYPVSITALQSYSKSLFQADLFAGLTVGVVALPLAMAFAIACGLPPERGIYTAIAAGFIVSLLGGSRYQIGGPTGAFVVIIAAIVAKYGLGGLAAATLMAGIFLIIFGFCKMGALIKFIPFPVTTGFTTGIAVVIFSTQIKDLFGLNIAAVPAEFFPKIKALVLAAGSVNTAAAALGIGTIAVIVLCSRFLPKFPAMLIGMLAATAVAVAFQLPVENIGDRFGDLPRTLPSPALPVIDWKVLPDLVMPAMTIALLAAIESLLSATVADGMTGDRHRPNVELVAQGAGNIAAICFGGIPATGAIARTATNIKCGGKTPVAGMIHAVTLALILLLFAPWAKLIPLAALAGILSVVCYNMSEIKVFKRLLKGPKSDAVVMLTTFLLTVMIDLVVAVEVGVVLAALLFIRRMSEISNVSVITGELAGEDEEHDDPLSMQSRVCPEGTEVFEIQGPFFFGAIDAFRDSVLQVFDRNVKVVILRTRMVPAIDATGLQVLRGFAENCRKRGIRLVLSGVHPQPRKAYRQCGFEAELGIENFCGNIDQALARARELVSAESPQ